MSKLWAKVPGAWRRRGYADQPTGVRSSLVYGTYEPDLGTAGTITPKAVLMDGSHNYNSPSATAVTIADGEVITSKVIYGKITHAGAATINDCIALGSPNALTANNDAVVTCTNVRSGIAVYTDCEIYPQKESAGRNCFLGWQYEAYRCWAHGGEDIFGAYNTTGTDANVKIKGCLVEDMAYTYPDRDHGDGSHCDGIQIQGSHNIEIVGNAIKGTAHWMTGSSRYYPTDPTHDLGDWTLTKSPAQNPGAGIIVSWASAGGVDVPVDGSVIIDGNYFRYCKAQLLVKSTANNFVCTNNKFSSVSAPVVNINGTVYGGYTLAFTHNSYWFRGDSLSASGDIVGMTSGGVMANTTNKWLDGPSAGSVIATPRSAGVNWDAA